MTWKPGWRERAIKQVLFKCSRCGNCCSKCGIIDLYPEDLNRLARKFHITLQEEMMLDCAEHPLGGRRLMLNSVQPCKFYKDKCRIYNHRPLVCRLAPFLVGEWTLCDTGDLQIPDMEEQALWVALVKMSGLSVTEMQRYLKMIGAWE
jgi:Fe-S-cluster containining protein